jgi:hypothetical protein
MVIPCLNRCDQRNGFDTDRLHLSAIVPRFIVYRRRVIVELIQARHAKSQTSKPAASTPPHHANVMLASDPRTWPFQQWRLGSPGQVRALIASTEEYMLTWMLGHASERKAVSVKQASQVLVFCEKVSVKIETDARLGVRSC